MAATADGGPNAGWEVRPSALGIRPEPSRSLTLHGLELAFPPHWSSYYVVLLLLLRSEWVGQLSQLPG